MWKHWEIIPALGYMCKWCSIIILRSCAQGPRHKKYMLRQRDETVWSMFLCFVFIVAQFNWTDYKSALDKSFSSLILLTLWASLLINVSRCDWNVLKTHKNCLRFRNLYVSTRRVCGLTLIQAIFTVAFHNNVVSEPRLTKNTNCLPSGSMHLRDL